MLLCVIFLWSVIFHSDYWWYSLKSIFRGNQGIFLLEHTARRTYIPDIAQSDEEFFKTWGEESVYGQGFTYDDIKFTIEEKCPVLTDRQIEDTWAYLLEGIDYYSDIDERSEGLKRIEVGKKNNEFKKKFLNKEFTALKDIDN